MIKLTALPLVAAALFGAGCTRPSTPPSPPAAPASQPAATPAAPHPLDALSSAEIETAAKVLRAAPQFSRHRLCEVWAGVNILGHA